VAESAGDLVALRRTAAAAALAREDWVALWGEVEFEQL
jgi:hypothetical protein